MIKEQIGCLLCEFPSFDNCEQIEGFRTFKPLEHTSDLL